MQVKMPRWMEAFAVPATPWPPRTPERGKAQFEHGPKSFQLTAEECARFVRIVSDCGRIRRHYDLYRWLGGAEQNRITLRFEYWRRAGDGEELAARGEQEVACMRREAGGTVPAPLPAALRDALLPYG